MVSHDYYLNFRVIRYIFAFYSVVRIREIGVRRQEIGDCFIYSPYTLHPTPHTPHPTPYTLHPTPYTPHPTPHTPLPHTPLPHFPTSPMIAKKLHQEGNNFQ
ncbi:DNA gyrase subunit A [Microcystis aeruginosa NIES-44]|uniref:DNA gyrase subunit A n=1 Tax=Microcystis aeruginosa NIES-44 TaxID=449439 RepID=A0A0A1W1K5_MICAE|nr:DNA gyrase subunit A [Microcystis aeruginosa NIES-44]